MGRPGGKEAAGGPSPQVQLPVSFRAGAGARPSLLESMPEAGRCAPDNVQRADRAGPAASVWYRCECGM